MLSRWPIRNKLLAGLVMLIVVVASASGSGLYGLYAYRSLVKSLSSRANELPLATALIEQISDLRVSLNEAVELPVDDEAGSQATHAEGGELLALRRQLTAIQETLDAYRVQLDFNERYVSKIHAGEHERRTFRELETAFARILTIAEHPQELNATDRQRQLAELTLHMQALAGDLPAYLHERIRRLASEVQLQYRSLIYFSWATTIGGGLVLALLVKFFYDWIFRPLRVLIRGSRKVAAGQFEYRIALDTHDEMAELAEAMNDMTSRFRAIRDDLDHQVQERTKQVVRSEQLASVGFLAAGVAHEINNPLASIAMCAESLEGRLSQALGSEHPDYAVFGQYLKMMQDEAFRCKEITEKLLDFSRLGDVQRQDLELREVVQGVVDMVSHLGKYQNKRVELADGPRVLAHANLQEIKQVVLNLITNGLDSVDAGGVVRITIAAQGGQARMDFSDNGCGMTPEVQQHLFEPFFTRRRGGQGTGLGLSITYRIIADHGGAIEAKSAGPGRGSHFCVSLPLARKNQEKSHHYQAA